MLQTVPTVAIIDPDDSFRNTVAELLTTMNINVSQYSDAETFLQTLDDTPLACLVSETRLPGISGLELLESLTALKKNIPTILMTQESDVSLAVRAMRSGAMDFVEKPFVEPVLLNLIRGIVSTGTATDQSVHNT